MTLSTFLGHVSGGSHGAPPRWNEMDRGGHEYWPSSSGKGSTKGNGAAMSALTLLAFLFFLNILQNCLRDSMTTTTQAPVLVMMAGAQNQRFRRQGDEEDVTESATSTPAAETREAWVRLDPV